MFGNILHFPCAVVSLQNKVIWHSCTFFPYVSKSSRTTSGILWESFSTAEPSCTHLPATQGIRLSLQLLHGDGEGLNLARATQGFLLEHVCPLTVCWAFLHVAATAAFHWCLGPWGWWALELQAGSQSTCRLPSLLEELHRVLLRGRVGQVHRALPMQ